MSPNHSSNSQKDNIATPKVNVSQPHLAPSHRESRNKLMSSCFTTGPFIISYSGHMYVDTITGSFNKGCRLSLRLGRWGRRRWRVHASVVVGPVRSVLLSASEPRCGAVLSPQPLLQRFVGCEWPTHVSLSRLEAKRSHNMSVQPVQHVQARTSTPSSVYTSLHPTCLQDPSRLYSKQTYMHHITC